MLTTARAIVVAAAIIGLALAVREFLPRYDIRPAQQRRGVRAD
jgi:hypothetical protein